MIGGGLSRAMFGGVSRRDKDGTKIRKLEASELKLAAFFSLINRSDYLERNFFLARLLNIPKAESSLIPSVLSLRMR